MGSRFSCTVLMCLVMCSCTEPIPIEDPDTRGTELEDDSTSNVNTNLNWEGWNDPVRIGLASGDEVADFATWTVRYDMWCKMRFFSDILHKDLAGEKSSVQRGPVSLLTLLPDEFTKQQVEALRMAQGMKPDPKLMISNWIKRGQVKKDAGRGVYIKVVSSQ